MNVLTMASDVTEITELRLTNDKLTEENEKLTKLLKVTEKFRAMLISVVNHCKCDVEMNIRIKFNFLMQEYYDCKCDHKSVNDNFDEEISNETIDHTKHFDESIENEDESNASDDIKSETNNTATTGHTLSHNNNKKNSINSVNTRNKKNISVKDNLLYKRTKLNTKSNEEMDSLDLRERIARLRRYVSRPKIYSKVKSDDSGDQRFPCSWPGCDAVYRARSELKSHMWRHTGEKVFVCEWPGCDKRFPVKRNLARHRETHEGVKHYSCDWPGCEYKSWYPQGVRAHRKRHTDERPHKCSWPHCDWTFRQSHHLKAHMLKHTGEKPFECVWPECGHRFQSRQAMRFHVERAHKC